jgi:hypothetical protein
LNPRHGPNGGRGAAAHAEHLDDLDVIRRFVRLHRRLHGGGIGRRDVERPQPAREPQRERGDDTLLLLVVVGGNPLRRRQHLLHRRVEPAIDAVANELAADDQHQHRRNDRHPEQRRHQLGAEARERQRAPALHDELDDVARQDERQRHEDREVGRRQRVEDELGEKVGCQRRRPAGEREQRGQRADERRDAEQNELGVVEERAAFAVARPALRRCDGGLGWHDCRRGRLRHYERHATPWRRAGPSARS